MLRHRWVHVGAAAIMMAIGGASSSQASLVAYFPFENSLSSSGTVSLGAPTVTGTPAYVGGDVGFGQALDLPGGGGLYIEYPSGGTAIDLDKTSYTISAKVMLDVNIVSPQFRLFATDNALSGSNHAWGLRTAGGNPFLWYHDGADIGGGSFSTGVWHNVVMHFDAATGTRRLIVDNVIVDRATGVSATGVDHDLNLRIGDYTSGGGQGANAKLDDIRIYNEALSLQLQSDVIGGAVIGGDVFHLFDSPVPEPSMLGVVALGLFTMARRRSQNI